MPLLSAVCSRIPIHRTLPISRHPHKSVHHPPPPIQVCHPTSLAPPTSSQFFPTQELLNAARANIEAVAAGWSREEKDACIEETPQTFRWAGSLVGLITTGPADAPADGSFGGWWRRTMRMD